MAACAIEGAFIEAGKMLMDSDNDPTFKTMGGQKVYRADQHGP